MEGLGAGLEGEGMGGVYNKMARGVLFWIGGGRGEGRSSASQDAFPSSAWERQGRQEAGFGNDRGAGLGNDRDDRKRGLGTTGERQCYKLKIAPRRFFRV